MRRGTASALLGASIVAGVAAGMGASSLTPDASTKGWQVISTPAPATEGVEVRNPVLVMNDDGTATLSAVLTNHTDTALDLNGAAGGRQDDYDPALLLVFGNRSDTALEPGVPTRIGGVGDAFRIRFRDRVQPTSTLPMTLQFLPHDGPAADATEVTLLAPVVERDTTHSEVANNAPNTEITVHDGVVVVVPGQAKAYIGGYLTATVQDMTEIRPVAVRPNGRELEVLHQTATGGPSGFFATPDEQVRLGNPPYLDTGEPGDADYLRADDVVVGETVDITFRFPSGDVTAKFKVVQGRSDGTI